MASSVEAWVEEISQTTHPDSVVWCDGSDAENERLVGQMLSDGTLLELNQDVHPNSYLHRSNPHDVARTEHLTFICSNTQEEAGPNNNWMAPAQMRSTLQNNSSRRRFRSTSSCPTCSAGPC